MGTAAPVPGRLHTPVAMLLWNLATYALLTAALAAAPWLPSLPATHPQLLAAAALLLAAAAGSASLALARSGGGGWGWLRGLAAWDAVRRGYGVTLRPQAGLGAESAGSGGAIYVYHTQGGVIAGQRCLHYDCCPCSHTPLLPLPGTLRHDMPRYDPQVPCPGPGGSPSACTASSPQWQHLPAPTGGHSRDVGSAQIYIDEYGGGWAACACIRAVGCAALPTRPQACCLLQDAVGRASPAHVHPSGGPAAGPAGLLQQAGHQAQAAQGEGGTFEGGWVGVFVCVCGGGGGAHSCSLHWACCCIRRLASQRGSGRY
jgi:hypothetical protein